MNNLLGDVKKKKKVKISTENKQMPIKEQLHAK